MWRLFVAPVAFFASRRAAEVSWRAAIVPLAVYLVATLVSVEVFTVRTLGAYRGALADRGLADVGLASWVSAVIAGMSTAFGLTIMFWCHVGAVMLFDLLLSFSGQHRKLIECVALAHWPSAAWSGVSAIILVLWFVPGDVTLPVDLSPEDVQRTTARYIRDLQTGSSVLLTIQALSVLVGGYVAGLSGVVLMVVSRLSVWSATVAALVIGVTFTVLPWAAQRF